MSPAWQSIILGLRICVIHVVAIAAMSAHAQELDWTACPSRTDVRLCPEGYGEDWAERQANRICDFPCKSNIVGFIDQDYCDMGTGQWFMSRRQAHQKLCTGFATGTNVRPEPTPEEQEAARRSYEQMDSLIQAMGGPSIEVLLDTLGVEEADTADRDNRPAAKVEVNENAAEAASPELVEQIQTDLGALGYDPGPADGTISTKTRLAIGRFEAEHGLSFTGQPSFELAYRIRLVMSRQ